MAVRSLLAALVAVALLAGCEDDSDPAASFQILGTWGGELHQKDLDPFRVKAAIGDLADPTANTVHYTGIDCGGNWRFLGRDGSAYRFREVIDRGAGGDCKGVGIVTLTPSSADELDYEFRGGGIESFGVLSRTN